MKHNWCLLKIVIELFIRGLFVFGVGGRRSLLTLGRNQEFITRCPKVDAYFIHAFIFRCFSCVEVTCCVKVVLANYSIRYFYVAYTA